MTKREKLAPIMGIIALIKDGGKGNFSNYTLSNQINLSYLQSICGEKKNFVYIMGKSKFYEIH